MSGEPVAPVSLPLSLLWHGKPKKCLGGSSGPSKSYLWRIIDLWRISSAQQIFSGRRTWFPLLAFYILLFTDYPAAPTFDFRELKGRREGTDPHLKHRTPHKANQFHPIWVLLTLTGTRGTEEVGNWIVGIIPLWLLIKLWGSGWFQLLAACFRMWDNTIFPQTVDFEAILEERKIPL